ncbi:MAG: glycosyltransferase [Terrimicrobiaceae bacterium]|nr:glycosyltransferase [Terrimicrobiaceae bacterium]
MHLTCITHTPELYGANLSMLAWIRVLKRRGHEFLVVGPSGPIARACDDLEIDFFPFQPLWWAGEPGTVHPAAVARGLLAGRFGHRSLANRVAAFQPDWIYSNSGVTPLGWLLARRLRRPHVWHLREFIDLDFGFSMALGWRLARRAFAQADATISVSKAVRRHLLPRTRASRHVVIYEGIGTRDQLRDRVKQASERPITNGLKPFHFVLVGMMQANKGQELAMRALATLRARGHDARLTLVGGGPESRLQNLATDLGIANDVMFAGHLRDPAPAVLAAHASLMCSRSEAFGRTTVEAMSLGRPVIGITGGATPELLAHGQNGLLCEGTPAALSAAMERLVTSPGLAARLGARGATVSQRYCDEAYADGIERLLLETPTHWS